MENTEGHTLNVLDREPGALPEYTIIGSISLWGVSQGPIDAFFTPMYSNQLESF